MAELTKQAEDQLIRAIQDVIRLVDDQGLEPTDAIVKVANDGTWSPHFVRRMCEVYNIGRQESQRKCASAVLDKFASFALADGDAALKRLFPTGLQKDAGVASDYSQPPAWYSEPAPRKKTPSILEKLAAAEPQAEPRPDIGKLLSAIYTTTKKAEIAAQVVFEAKEHIKAALSDLGRYFRRGPLERISFDRAEKIAGLYYGPRAQPVMNYIHARHCPQEKRASDETDIRGQLALHSLNNAPAPFSLLYAVIKAGAELDVANKEFGVAKLAHLEAFGKYVEAKEEICRPFRNPSSILTPSVFQQKTGGFPAMAGGMSIAAMTKSLVDDGLKAVHSRPTPDQLVDKEWQALEDPAHDEELRKIRVQAMLSDLMANDDVINKHDPSMVLNKFNELQGMMPSLASQPAAMRPYLRRALQGHMEPFEAQEMARLQSTVQPNSDTSPFAVKSSAPLLELPNVLTLG